MNYTENYHLPQWVKTDRIMMDDFNAAMADLESGLSEGKTVRDQTVNRVYRLAYNHFCAVREMDPFPDQVGMFYQDLTKDHSNLTGTFGWPGARFGGRGGGTLSGSDMTQYCQEVTPLVIVENALADCSPLTVRFRAPTSGFMLNYSVSGSFVSNSYKSNYRLRITMTNQDAGTVEHTAEVTLSSIVGNAGGFSHVIKDRFEFQGNTNYLITFQPLDAVWNAEGHIAFTDTTFMIQASLFNSDGIVTAAHTMNEPASGAGGFAVLHCSPGGEGGQLRFVWDGQEREPVRTRLVPMHDGLVFQELLYVREDEVPADSKISLRFESGEKGSILLRDWGVVLL